MDRQTAVVMKDFSLSFMEHLILERVNLQIPKGEVTAIVGPSGSGKTCFLRAINRLNECFPRCQVSGELKLFLDGAFQDIYKDKVSLPALRRQVQMLFQSPNVLPMSIEKNIQLPLKLAGLSREGVVEEYLSLVGLWDEVKDRLKKPAHNLSGGQQGRLCLARALALKPQILLADEPTANLDSENAGRIEELLLHLSKEMTVIWVTHDEAQAERASKNILRMAELPEEARQK